MTARLLCCCGRGFAAGLEDDVVGNACALDGIKPFDCLLCSPLQPLSSAFAVLAILPLSTSTMFKFVLKTAALLAAVTLVAAIPAPGDDGSQCNTGTQQCCESVQVSIDQHQSLHITDLRLQKASEVSQTVVGALEGLVSFILTDANSLLGLDWYVSFTLALFHCLTIA